MPYHQLYNYFHQFLPLNAEEQAVIGERTSFKKVKRRHYILQEGDQCKHLNFVVEGCFKMYHVDKKGTAHNIQFAAENDWITDLGSFHGEHPSKMYIEAMEPSAVIQFSRRDLIFLYEHYPKFDRNFRVMIENAFVELQSRLLDTISSTALERYVNFLEKFPHLNNRLPNTQIASYLGITPEFLSKVRKDLMQK